MEALRADEATPGLAALSAALLTICMRLRSVAWLGCLMTVCWSRCGGWRHSIASRQALAETSFGQQLSIGEALKLADEAAISLLVRDARGVVLSHGVPSGLPPGPRPWH
jgi:hypothetical protein